MAKIEGLERLNRKLNRMPVHAKRRLRETLEQNADQLLSLQRTLAARNRRSGQTIESLQKEQGDHELQVKVFSDHFAARYEEFGTAKMAAIPFFFPAYRLLRGKFKTAMRAAIRKSIKEVVRGG
jgi:HK97 gp10 family phage protein